MDHDELDPDEESEFAVRYMHEKGEDDEDVGEDEADLLEEESLDGLGRMQPEEW